VDGVNHCARVSGGNAYLGPERKHRKHDFLIKPQIFTVFSLTVPFFEGVVKLHHRKGRERDTNKKHKDVDHCWSIAFLDSQPKHVALQKEKEKVYQARKAKD
jgi:hypothetical protein